MELEIRPKFSKIIISTLFLSKIQIKVNKTPSIKSSNALFWLAVAHTELYSTLNQNIDTQTKKQKTYVGGERSIPSQKVIYSLKKCTRFLLKQDFYDILQKRFLMKEYQNSQQ